MEKSLIARTTLLGAFPIAGLLAFAPLSGGAQDSGGVQLTFGVEQRFETNDNLGLDVVSAGTTSQATTRLSFGLLTETRSSSLEFNTSASLRVANGPDFSGTEVALADPRMSLAYSRSTANAKLDVNARLRQTDVEFLRSLEEFIDDKGEIVLPEDTTGTGTQISHGLDVALTWGEEAPLGFGLSAGISGINYIDTTSASLFDSRRSRAGASVRLTLTPVTEANVSLRFSTYDDEDPMTSRRDTLSFGAGLTHTLPRGRLTSRLTADDTEDGTRLGLSFGRDFDLPDGALQASMGATRGASGETNLTGSLKLRKELPQGAITAELRRSVSAGSDDSEQLATALLLGYSQDLTPLSSLNLDLSYVQREPTGAGASITDGTVSATYRRAVTEDWNMDVGYRHRVRDEDGVGRARSNSVFMVLKRDFSIRR